MDTWSEIRKIQSKFKLNEHKYITVSEAKRYLEGKIKYQEVRDRLKEAFEVSNEKEIDKILNDL